MKKVTLIKPVPLTAHAFAAFGNVIEVSSQGESKSINHGNTIRYHDLAALDLMAKGGKPSVNIFRSSPLSRPVMIHQMERHPLSSQLFFPLGNKPYLVVVAPKGDFNFKDIQAFLATAHQGVNYHPGVWHHYSLALDGVSDFLVIDRLGPDENCQEVSLRDDELVCVGY
ncbi:MAG: ureidoglycolate lyase [Alphaproteobacteria bacterium]|nr:MAG: ureidoglycolate lyase [Alphaproteobacteria bacterium]